MKPWVGLVCLALAAGCFSQALENLVVNGEFAGDEDGDGVADGWQYSAGVSGDKLDVTPSLEALPDGSFAQKLSCTRYEDGHVMLAQVGTVAVTKGRWYEIKLRAKGAGLRSFMVGLHDTDGWRQLGLWRGVTVTKRWREVSYRFQANRDCHETTRLQFWFTRVGTVWIADVSVAQSSPPTPDTIIPTTGHKNLLPNAGFEALGGWGMVNYWTYGWSVAKGEGLDGSNCAAVKWMPDDPEFAYQFDYFEMENRPLVHPYLQAIGQAPLEAGKTYTLSAWMRCEPGYEGAPAMLGFRGPGARAVRDVTLAAQWRRYSVSCEAQGDRALIQLGPNMGQEDVERYAGCTVYIDGAQLELADEASTFEAHPLEVLVGHRHETLESTGPTTVTVQPCILCSAAGEAQVEVSARNFSDETVATVGMKHALRPGVNIPRIELDLPGPGFYRVQAAISAGERSARAAARWAFYPPGEPASESAFGINHAYAYDGFLRLARRIGITWVRDWSLKWEHVETRRGAFSFDETDFQINRPRGLGMNVLCMFPFPSAEWSSTAEEELRQSGYPANRIRQAFAPRDPRDLGNYAYRCVDRYKSRVKYWEVFNESIFTDYSLPGKYDYEPEDYVPLLKVVYDACKRADPECRVIGGYSANPSQRKLYGPMFEEGGLQYCDLVSLHQYPGGPPENLDTDLRRLNELMAQHGGRKPTWFTEYAYYADDDSDVVSRRWPVLLDSEWHQACYNTRACVIMLAGGVEKIFYHIWPTPMNQDSGARIFFEYAGAPRKIAVTQAALHYMLGATPGPVGRLEGLAGDVMGFIFQAPDYLNPDAEADSYVTVIWAPGEQIVVDRLESAECFSICGRRLTQQAITVGEAPVYLLTIGVPIASLSDQIKQRFKKAGGG